MTHRTAKLAAVYLLLGLVATWAVAWALTLTSSFGYATNTIYAAQPRDYWLLEDRRTLGGRRLSLMPLTDPDDVEGWLLEPGEAAPPLPPQIADPGPFKRVITIEQRGWPFKALVCGVEDHIQTPRVLTYMDPDWPWTPVWHSGARKLGSIQCSHTAAGAFVIESKAEHANQTLNAILLPCLPLWPGLLANTLLYALLIAALHQLTAWGRRARRRRRGRCAACGYDLSGLASTPCPECGHNP